MHERLRIANSCENAVFLSVHMNSFPQEKYCGLQVYYSRNSIDSMRFAESVQGTVSKYLQPQNERKIKQGKDIFLLDRLKMPAILVECGFLSNKDECSLLSTEEYRDKLAFWIFYSIMCEIN
jgi:N-acetylmuramoyl-L-alanine amidase